MAPTQKSYSITVKDLKPNREYIVKVVALNSLKGRGQWATTTVKTDRRCAQVRPSSIGNVYANQASASVLFLSWLPPSGSGCATDYDVVGEDASGSRVYRGSSTQPDVRVAGLQPGRQYVFRIEPKNNRGSGPTKRVTYRMQQRQPQGGPVASGSVPAGRR